MTINAKGEGPGLLPMLPLRSGRLIVRLFNAFDGEALFHLHRDALVTRHAGGTRSEEESESVLRRILAKSQLDGLAPLAVEEIETGRVVGWCGVQRLFGSVSEYELIYALQSSSWGKGYATEAASTVISAVAKATNPKITRIWGVVFPQNMASIRVLEKLGMEFQEHRFDATSQRHACAYLLTNQRFDVALQIAEHYSSDSSLQ